MLKYRSREELCALFVDDSSVLYRLGEYELKYRLCRAVAAPDSR